MNIIEAIKLYAHLMQQSGGGLDGRKIAFDALTQNNVATDVITSIGNAIDNHGNIRGEKNERFAITQIAAS